LDTVNVFWNWKTAPAAALTCSRPIFLYEDEPAWLIFFFAFVSIVPPNG